MIKAGRRRGGHKPSNIVTIYISSHLAQHGRRISEARGSDEKEWVNDRVMRLREPLLYSRRL